MTFWSKPEAKIPNFLFLRSINIILLAKDLLICMQKLKKTWNKIAKTRSISSYFGIGNFIKIAFLQLD